MIEYVLALVGGCLLSLSLAGLYMKVMEKLGSLASEQILGVITLVAGIVLLAIAPYMGA